MGIIQDMCDCGDGDELRNPEGQSMINTEPKPIKKRKKRKKSKRSKSKKRGSNGKYEIDDDTESKIQQIIAPKDILSDDDNLSNRYSLDTIKELPTTPPDLESADSSATAFMKSEINKKRDSILQQRDLWRLNSMHGLTGSSKDDTLSRDDGSGSDYDQKRDYSELRNSFDLWNEQSKEWYTRMEELYDFILRIKPTTRDYIWYSFDKQKGNELGTKMFIPKLMYSYVVLCTKSNNKQAVAPKFKALKYFLIWITLEIIDLMPVEQKVKMKKSHYDSCFLMYLEQIVEQ